MCYDYEQDCQLHIFRDNPLVQHKLTTIRDKSTKWDSFWQNIGDLTLFLIFQYMDCGNRRRWGMECVPIQTGPIVTGNNRLIDNAPQLTATHEPLVFSLFRGGTPMANAILRHLPFSSIVHVVYGSPALDERETSKKSMLQGEKWITETKGLERIHSVKDRTLLIVDPIIGTGNSMIAILDYIKARFNVEHTPDHTAIFAISAYHGGLRKIREQYSQIPILVTNIEPDIDERGFLIPGFGDVGARCFQSEIET